MAKRKIPIKNIKEIRKSFKEKKKEAFEAEGVDVSITLNEQIAIAKDAGKTSKINETGMSPKELIKESKKKLKSIKKDYTSTIEVSSTWNFEEGDVVSFKYRNQEEVGIIIQMWNYSKKTIEAAKNSGSVTLLSSAGRVRVKPIEVIDKI